MNAQNTIETRFTEEKFTSADNHMGHAYNVLYVHGLSSSGSSSIAGFLRQLLPEYDILSPDFCKM